MLSCSAGSSQATDRAWNRQHSAEFRTPDPATNLTVIILSLSLTEKYGTQIARGRRALRQLDPSQRRTIRLIALDIALFDDVRHSTTARRRTSSMPATHHASSATPLSLGEGA